ncbi:hypothetical protein ACTU3I_03060 [Microbacterium sp. RD1]|uniref:hypothetical protein n=1 Tax=Microbacterium sp. RD1 TaxID=3457313 RepID=UPI003FA59A92
MDRPADDRPGMLPRDIVRTAFASEQAIYGVLLVSGMIVVAGRYGGSSWEVLTTVLATVVVFWAAHVYAGAVAHHGIDEGGVLGIRASLRISVRESWGLLLSALIPCAVLFLGTLQVVPDLLARWAAMWTGVAVLATLGYLAFRRRGASMLIRVLGGITTSLFGVVLVILKAVVH